MTLSSITPDRPITPELIDTLAATLAPVIGDAARILADAALSHPPLAHEHAADVVTDFVGRVLERCVAALDNAPVFAARDPAADAALVGAVWRCVARWPMADAGAVAAWARALDLFATASPLAAEPLASGRARG